MCMLPGLSIVTNPGIWLLRFDKKLDNFFFFFICLLPQFLLHNFLNLLSVDDSYAYLK